MTIAPQNLSLDPGVFDATHWPTVFARFPELGEANRVDRVLGGVSQILALQHPFVLVWVPPSHDHDDEPQEDERQATIWLKANRRQLNTYCRGYIYETADRAMQEVLQGRILEVAKMYSFPLQITPSRPASLSAAGLLLA